VKTAAVKKPFYKGLFFQVIVAIILGALFGYCFPSGNGVAGLGEKMEPLGKGFINLIKMMIAPIIFCTIVSGVASMGDMKLVGRIGAKSLLCFEVITTFAMIIGLIVVNILRPGEHMNIDIHTVDTSAVHSKIAAAAHSADMVDFFLNIIPSTLVSAFSSGEILQVLLVAILFAAALPSLGEKGKQMLSFLDIFAGILFKMVDFITRLSPIGAFGAMAYTVGKFGIGSLRYLGELVLVFYGTCILFVIIAFVPIMMFYCRLSTWKLLKFLKEEFFIVLGTSSSESVMPRLMEKMERIGCRKNVVAMVIPTGYSFNLIGSSIYFTMGALFIAFATNTEITIWKQLSLLGVLLIASKGAAGVSGSAFIVLAATLSSLNIMPQQSLEQGLALIFAVDRFMSTGRALTNMVGEAITTIIVAKWENALDHEQAVAMLEEGSDDL